MSSYLGFKPTTRPDYYFLSYNNEDSERLTPFLKKFIHYNIPLWYDYGIEYGSSWEKEIADRIQKCQAVLLFITKGIFKKENSFVRIEYNMAVKFFNKDVYIVVIDKIQGRDIPNAFLSWWIELQQRQNLIKDSYPSDDRFFDECKKMLRIDTPLNRKKTLMELYEQLIKVDNREEAEKMLSELLHIKELETKAYFLLQLLSSDYIGRKFRTQILNDKDKDLRTVIIKGYEFKARSRTVFRGLNNGDADVTDITRDGTRIFTMGGLVDAQDGRLLYDEANDLLFVIYGSFANVYPDHPMAETVFYSVCVVEDPCGSAICHDFRNQDLIKINP